MSEIPETTSIPPSAPPPGGMLQKLVTLSLWLVLLGVVLVVLVSKLMPPKHPEMPVLFQASRFSLTDQNGNTVSAESLRGQAYICDFIFTTCGGSCPLMSRQMADIQARSPMALHLVSFTVNPEHDTPSVLKEYATNLAADPARWHFLTGTPEQMTDVAVAMRIVKAGEKNRTVSHSELFFLVDGDGNVRGMYHRDDAKDMRAIIEDATWLVNSRGARGGS